ncbi:bacteriophage Gp15 family protein [Clostridioides difficile]|uniref:Bacteriophage Gp15 protein n=1 Tax=Clostridium phage phiCD146 TaxID=1582151 RepID=A0A0A8WHV7_9CAUD|nr:bacteriophage Gp15 family protein [Clostridioides difficile]YP_009214142.1 bacterioGp15 family protein [Clostridium phage phiCD146]MBH7002488.1 bacteriophage Gp15 family protein [Clostridioides difficile]MBH7225032.1 bacteriophage Gp15 family protein [Clostridioides difficile]MBY2217694.1 bacteriophage Gp15 family protein [Clostridioides difficile]MCH4300248.1 bacteriophage Gp15 family protein [Clostridioides difficile]MCR1656654.1 bacteriophage Gp15 family protein [Clostridioides difficil
MNMLVDILPESVEIDGKEYKINTDFRISILFEMLIQDNSISDEEKGENALLLYYPVIPANTTMAIDKIIWFYSCGKKENNVDDGYQGGAGSSKSQIYSYDHDDEYIYSAFLGQYGIDLQDIEKLHWWKFKALFKSLKEDTEIVKIMGYRAMDISGDMPKAQKDFYRKMKKIHAIPLPQNEVEKINEIEKALLNGGDISNLL